MEKKAMNYPSTVIFPDAFEKSKSAGNDGVFDWSWTDGCFGDTKISPMDIDGFVERNGQFLIFETKNHGVPVKQGQMIALKAMHRLGCFTVAIIHGKTFPEEAEIWYPNSQETRKYYGSDEIRERVKAWYAWADRRMAL
jgi:hypothetical protein